MQATDGTGQQGHVSPKHVYVDGAPGILLDWRAVEGRWEAYVVYAVGEARATTEWVDESRVQLRT